MQIQVYCTSNPLKCLSLKFMKDSPFQKNQVDEPCKTLSLNLSLWPSSNRPFYFINFNLKKFISVPDMGISYINNFAYDNNNTSEMSRSDAARWSQFLKAHIGIGCLSSSYANHYLRLYVTRYIICILHFRSIRLSKVSFFFPHISRLCQGSHLAPFFGIH